MVCCTSGLMPELLFDISLHIGHVSAFKCRCISSAISTCTITSGSAIADMQASLQLKQQSLMIDSQEQVGKSSKL